MSISVVILTKNEALDLPGCLASVAWSDDVHIFDSFSSDATIEIAFLAGATVHQRQFDGYASQRNASLSLPQFRNRWVLVLDADERCTRTLVAEAREFVASAGDSVAAARIPRRDFLWGKWLRHAQITSTYIRLVRPEMVHYEREVNEVLIADGEVGALKEHLEHYPFSKGITHWISKHNTYSSMEAARAVEEIGLRNEFSIWRALFARDLQSRRYHQKGLFYRMPLRPVLKVVYMLVFRGAILDGKSGIIYSLLQGIYEYFIVLKQRELVDGRP